MNAMYVDTKYMMLKSLKVMSSLLEKVEAERLEKNISEEELMDSKLAPDMFPFVRQVQMMSDNAKGAMARLSGVEIPSMEDIEKTLPELIERLNKTITFVENTSDEALKEADSRKIIITYFKDKYQTSEDYTRDFAIPNYYFHFVTAYAILRMKGFTVGKQDFLGGLNLRDM